MIKFYVDKTKVAAYIEVEGLKTEARYPHFSFEAGSELSAELLSKALNSGFNNGVERIREDAYNEGYRLGRGKKAKWSFIPNTWKFRYSKD